MRLRDSPGRSCQQPGYPRCTQEELAEASDAALRGDDLETQLVAAAAARKAAESALHAAQAAGKEAAAEAERLTAANRELQSQARALEAAGTEAFSQRDAAVTECRGGSEEGRRGRGQARAAQGALQRRREASHGSSREPRPTRGHAPPGWPRIWRRCRGSWRKLQLNETRPNATPKAARQSKEDLARRLKVRGCPWQMQNIKASEEGMPSSRTRTFRCRLGEAVAPHSCTPASRQLRHHLARCAGRAEAGMSAAGRDHD